MRRREELMEEQNIVNEKKDRNAQRKETELVTERKLGEGAIRKMGAQGEIATTSKLMEKRHPKN